jgi:hypothetical protein
VDSFQVRQLIIIRIDAAAEEQTGITPVNDFVASELIVSSWVLGFG